MTDYLQSPALSVLHGARILVADDDMVERNLLGNYLHQKGCRVFMASDGRDALMKALAVKPDVVLMDIQMPVCDGITACQLLKQQPETRQLPVIFITNAVLPEQRVEGLRAGAVDYVTKPFNFEEILLRLSIHLAHRDVPADGEPAPAAAKPLDQTLFMLAQPFLQNLAQTADPNDIAKKLNCNVRRLNEAFRRCVGVTMLEYQREQRMKEATQLLAQTAIEVRDIAAQLGFTSGANFATAFKERFSVSPSDYRRWQTLPDHAPEQPRHG